MAKATTTIRQVLNYEATHSACAPKCDYVGVSEAAGF